MALDKAIPQGSQSQYLSTPLAPSLSFEGYVCFQPRNSFHYFMAYTGAYGLTTSFKYKKDGKTTLKSFGNANWHIGMRYYRRMSKINRKHTWYWVGGIHTELVEDRYKNYPSGFIKAYLEDYEVKTGPAPGIHAGIAWYLPVKASAFSFELTANLGFRYSRISHFSSFQEDGQTYRVLVKSKSDFINLKIAYSLRVWKRKP